MSISDPKNAESEENITMKPHLQAINRTRISEEKKNNKKTDTRLFT